MDSNFTVTSNLTLSPAVEDVDELFNIDAPSAAPKRSGQFRDETGNGF